METVRQISNWVDNLMPHPATSVVMSEDYQYTQPVLIKTDVYADRIELIYKQDSMVDYGWPFKGNNARVYKRVYSCQEGKWHVSEPIYGEIIPAQEESYEFQSERSLEKV